MVDKIVEIALTIVSLVILFGPAAYCLIKLRDAKDGGHDLGTSGLDVLTITATLMWTLGVAIWGWAQNVSGNSDLRDVCEDFEEELADHHDPDEEDLLPYECDEALGYAEPIDDYGN